MINLKKEKKESAQLSIMGESEYPYGTQLDLDHESVEKLGIKKAPEIGSKVMLECLAEVVRVNMMADKDGEPCINICLQVTDLGMKPAKKEISVASKMYGEDD